MDNENNDPIKNVGGEKEEVKEAKVVDNVNNTTTDANSNKEMNVISLLSFIFSLIGLFIFGIPCGIAAVVLGIIGLAKAANKQTTNKWMAIAGLVIGILDILAVSFFVSQITQSIL